MAKLRVISNEKIAKDCYKIILEGEKKSFIPGQFVNLSVGTSNGLILKRPLSVNEVNDNKISLIYEIKGRGTQALSSVKQGELDAVYYLGNGFKLEDSDKKIMLIGGGMGAAPLFSVLKTYKDRKFYSYLGFMNKDRVILEQQYKALSETIISTDDGSYGKCGFITEYAISDIKRIKPDIILACGPKPMFKALNEITGVKVLVSMEERMGCGIGACLVCVCETIRGNKRVCKDGPIFDIKELIL